MGYVKSASSNITKFGEK